MKKILFLAALSILQASVVFAEGDPSDALITKIQGDVKLLRDGSEVSVKEGAALRPGDKLKTAPAATVDFSMNALAGCRVLPGSEVEVKDPKKKTMLVKLGSGKAVFNLEKLPQESSFKVETPTAVASVRGTQFSGSVENGASSFSVRDDAIEVLRMLNGAPVGDPIVITEGFSCDITGSGMDARPATGSELVSMEQVAAVQTCG